MIAQFDDDCTQGLDDSKYHSKMMINFVGYR